MLVQVVNEGIDYDGELGVVINQARVDKVKLAEIQQVWVGHAAAPPTLGWMNTSPTSPEPSYFGVEVNSRRGSSYGRCRQ